ncbi:MAG: biotin--[Lachnospiraceae bacterium]|nr:biotin--[acetyl-CoA-carboxylase] ligase [Lachnospiraceae bacterium]
MWEKEIQYYDCLDSTNLEARRQAKEHAPEGRVIVANQQTDGRGRRGRSWSSPDGNLYFSIILRPTLPLEQIPPLTLLMGLAVADALGCEQAKIKWPNDIVIDGKKVSGILAEMAPVEGGISPFIIIGVGVNISVQGLEEELQNTAIGIMEAAGRGQGREALLLKILELFETYYQEYCERGGFDSFVDRYNARCVNCNREVLVQSPAGDFRGTALGVNEKGELLVRRTDGSLECITAGEVSVRGIYGYV